ncbi:MAG: DegV family protein [Patescibacteria group bacterium]
MTKFVRIKAIIRINKGESFLFQTARTTSKALEKVKRLIRERANSPGLEKISVIYTKEAENPQEFANQLAEELEREVPVISTGAVLSCHGGPGVIGAVLIKKKT